MPVMNLRKSRWIRNRQDSGSPSISAWGVALEKIVSLAGEESVSLILMYAHKKNRIDEFLPDSTPFMVVWNAKSPDPVLRQG